MFKKQYIPNYISIFRLCLIPAFLYFYWISRDIPKAVATFVLAGVSDITDGYLARRNNWTSNLGRILDPVADKLMQTTVLICLSLDGIVPWWISAILIGKELLILAGATCLIKKFHFYVQSGWYGKMAVVLFYAVIVALMVFDNMSSVFRTILSASLIAAMLFALIMYYTKIFHKKVAKKHDLVTK
jgi:cardiolipin synthase